MKSVFACLPLAVAGICLAQTLGTAEVGQKTASLRNAKQLSVAILLYASDYDDRTPYVRSTMSLFAVVMPYLGGYEVCAATRVGSKYEFNRNLGGVLLPRLEDPAMTPLLHEPKPYADGTRVVAYADSHCKAVTKRMWPKVAAALTKKHQRPAGLKPLPSNHMVSSIPKAWREKIARGGAAPTNGQRQPRIANAGSFWHDR